MPLRESSAAVDPRRVASAARRRRVSGSASAAALLIAAAGAPPAYAQTPIPQSAQPAAVEEIVVTGTRIIRDGYEAPTPLTVVSVEQIQAAGRPNIADFVNTLPSLAGSATPQNSNNSVSNGGAGLNNLNLRNLGTVRTLVLLDGQRSVGSNPTGVVDINDFPQALISRVDVVTGGASAAYGSDALSGVVNFILDKKYVGVKGNIQGGVTTYGDDRNWKASLTAGMGFGGDRGHFLLNGEISYVDGVFTSPRPWNQQGWHIMINPTYSATNGQPQRLVLPQLSQSNVSTGSIITDTALKGIAFSANGTPYQFNYGSLVADPWMQGGEWKANDVSNLYSMDPRVQSQSVFSRVSYDITDDIEVFAQWNWAYSKTDAVASPRFNQGNIAIKTDNAFLPASVVARAQALGITTFRIGTFSLDTGLLTTDNQRTVNRFVVGGNGKLDAFDSRWTWDAYYQYGHAGVSKRFYDRIVANFANGLDSVRSPATGAIVCRSTLTSPGNGCVPYNPFGIGVNSQAAINYVTGNSASYVNFIQDVMAATLRGEPFADWAGPVSMAFGIEHRRESGGGITDAISAVNGYQVGNQAPTFGSYTVTEGFVETVIPLAKDTAWARAFDLNAVVRETSYSTSGLVTTWKIGATYSPIDAIRFRATRSRDIRAPNRQELFAAGVFTTNTLIDPFRNNAGTTYTTLTQGNPNLQPEKADTTGLGVVLQPSFFPGFSASFDYYNIDITNAIGNLGAQAIVDQCFSGNQLFCSAITRDPVLLTIKTILNSPFNFVTQTARGYDVEASYQLPLDNVNADWSGNLTFRALATFFLKNYTSNGVNKPTDTAGSNAGSGPPDYRYLATITYTGDPIAVTLTGRGISAGTYVNSNIECTTGCPPSTTDNVTVNNNHIDGALYLDTAFTYKFAHRENSGADAEAFLNITNIFNKDPALVAQGPGGVAFSISAANPSLYDVLGRTFRVGVRFKM